ncbi:MAG: hypothetical protein ABFS38_18630 [Bacteroidota bacterium]
MIRHTSLLLLALLFLAACDQRPSEKLVAYTDDVETRELQLSTETMNEIIQNIASPIEVASLIHSQNIPFSTSYLANPDRLSTNISNVEMAFNLGVLSANLWYLNINEKTGTALNHLSSIDRLADALQIRQFFDYATIKHLATTNSDLDSLMHTSINSFNNMEHSLREADRINLSAMMIAGAWMEGLFLATQVTMQESNEDLRSLIGKQKLILNDLLLILNNFKNEEVIWNYINDFETIKSIYDDVKITHLVGEPQTIEKDGMLKVIQTETSQVTMTDATLQKLIEITEQLRNMHLHIKS